MLQPNTISSLATFAMLAACAVGIGFMACFFIALTGEQHKTHVVHRVRQSGKRLVGYQPQQHRGPVIDPGAYIALGVLRITTALSSNHNQEVVQPEANFVRFTGLHQKPESAGGRVYRLG